MPLLKPRSVCLSTSRHLHTAHGQASVGVRRAPARSLQDCAERWEVFFVRFRTRKRFQHLSFTFSCAAGVKMSKSQISVFLKKNNDLFSDLTTDLHTCSLLKGAFGKHSHSWFLRRIFLIWPITFYNAPFGLKIAGCELKT